jgi:hypothetical protein
VTDFAISAEPLTHSFGSTPALTDVSLTVPIGTVSAVTATHLFQRAATIS